MSKIPDWAVKMAEALPIHGDGFPDESDMESIALALVEAEKRGIERAADLTEAGREVLDPLDNYRSTVMQDWENIELLAAAIRQLAEVAE